MQYHVPERSLSLAASSETTSLDATIPHVKDTAAIPMLAAADEAGDEEEDTESTTHAMKLLVNMTAAIPCSVVVESL